MSFNIQDIGVEITREEKIRIVKNGESIIMHT